VRSIGEPVGIAETEDDHWIVRFSPTSIWD
jgi:hypothetical protein